MATAHDIVKGAYQILGAVAPEDPMSAALGAMGLRLLNAMRAQWNAEGLPCYGLQVITKTATGAASYTMGVGGDIATRPNGIQQVTLDDGETTCTPSIARLDDLEATANRTEIGPPHFWALNSTYPLSVLHLYPAPASGTIRILAQVPFAPIANLSDDIPEPDWYELALEQNLAILLAPRMAVPLDDLTIQGAARAYEAVSARANPQPPPVIVLDNLLTSSVDRNVWTETRPY